MKRKATRIAVVLVLLAAVPVVWRVLLRLDVNRRLAAVRHSGLPLDGEELNHWYAAVPEDQNAALVLTQAFALHQYYPDDAHSEAVWNFKLPAHGHELTVEQTRLLQGYVATNGPMLARVEEAVRLPASRFPIDCTLLQATPLPHLLGFRQASRLNEFKAVLALQSGHPEVASASVETTLGLARTLDQEPILISQTMRERTLKSAVSTLERRIDAGPLSDQELTNLSAAFARTGTTNFISRALIGERALVAPYFRMSQEEWRRRHPPKPDDADHPTSPLSPSVAFRVLGFDDWDFGQFLLTMNTNITIARRPPPWNLAADAYFLRVSEASWKKYRPITALTFSAYVGSIATEVEGAAYHEMATTALAIERFRNQNHRLPETLEEIVPDFLSELPDDPFSGLPLAYRHTSKGYLLYSVGRDRVDNGGRERPEALKSDDKTAYDLPFIVDR